VTSSTAYRYDHMTYETPQSLELIGLVCTYIIFITNGAEEDERHVVVLRFELAKMWNSYDDGRTNGVANKSVS
jgi:hypothetical protein